MGNISIRTLTIQELQADPLQLQRFKDPGGRLIHSDQAWLDVLTSNPYAQPADVALILATDDDVVVGRLGLYAGLASIDSRRERIFFGQAFGLDPEYRTSGAGGMILLRALGAAGSLLASGGPDEACIRLYQAARFVDLKPLRRFLHFYRPDPLIQKVLGTSPLARPLAALTWPALALRNRLRAGGRGASALEYRAVSRFDADLDRVIERETRDHFPREAKALNWVLAHRQAWAFEIYRAKRLVGYCLLTESQRELAAPARGPDRTALGRTQAFTFGYLMDYALPDLDADVVDDLLGFCLEFFRRRRIDVFDCQVRDARLEACCRRRGLHEREGVKQYYRPPRGQRVGPDGSWFLTLATGDLILWY